MSWSAQVRTCTWISAHNIYSLTQKTTKAYNRFIYSLDEDADDEELPIDIYVNATMRNTSTQNIQQTNISTKNFNNKIWRLNTRHKTIQEKQQKREKK